MTSPNSKAFVYERVLWTTWAQRGLQLTVPHLSLSCLLLTHPHSLAMSPHRRVSTESQRKPSAVQDIFLGLAFSLDPQSTEKPAKNLEYTVILNDGTGVVESETYHFDFRTHGLDAEGQAVEAKRFAREILQLIRMIQTKKGMNVGFGRLLTL